MRSELGRFKRETLGEQLEEFGDELADFTNDFWSSLWGGRCLVDDSCAAGIAGCHRDDGIGKIQSSFETVKKAVRFDCNAPATYDRRTGLPHCITHFRSAKEKIDSEKSLGLTHLC